MKPGKNGIILVLLTLAWWKGAETGETSDDWLEATADVAWVVYEMASGTVPSRYANAYLHTVLCVLTALQLKARLRG